ncbi:MAG TPA: 50S ribosomal protein L10 [Gaiellales bacterium]|nr:50S ribosomal protein L10 [Gaiellales bacterium]
MNVDEKRAVVEELTARIRDAGTMIVTDYRGLSVTQVAELRRSLAETGATFHVAKNTLARIAAERAERPLLGQLLAGPTAIAFVSDDPAPVAKQLSEVARQTRILTIRGAVMEGRTLSADQVRQLGELPPKEVVLAQVVGTIVAPAQSTVAVLAAPLRELVAVIDAQISKLEAAQAA